MYKHYGKTEQSIENYMSLVNMFFYNPGFHVFHTPVSKSIFYIVQYVHRRLNSKFFPSNPTHT